MVKPNEEVMPEGEGPASEAKTIRIPKKLLERLARVAKDTDNNLTEVILHACRRLVADYDEKKGKK